MIMHNTIQGSALEKVIYGTPCSQAILQEAKRLNAQNVFVMTIPELSEKTDEIEKIKTSLGNRFAGIYDKMTAHTPIDLVLEATQEARHADIDMLVSVGGSSITDAGKVLSICLKHNLSYPEQLAEFHYSVDKNGNFTSPEFSGPDIHFIAVPTTLSGAEFTSIAGAKNLKKQIKEGYYHSQLVPNIVILDPMITFHTPDWLWHSTGIRAMDHTLETLGSSFSNDFCDGIAESALKLLFEGLRAVKKNPSASDARLKCQFGMWQSMMPGAAGVPMGASHAIGHVLGGLLNVPHGYTSCIIAPYVLRYNESHNKKKQCRISQALGFPDTKASKVIGDVVEELNLPRTLSSVGIEPEQFKEIAKKCMAEPWIWTNPRPISKEDQVIEILEMAF